MRYAHIDRERSSGGVEQYLRHLDRGLLQRHQITVIQMYLSENEVDQEMEIEHVGVGRIVWVPVPIRQSTSRISDLPRRIAFVCSRTFRMRRQEGEGLCRASFSAMQSLLRHRGCHFRYKFTILSDRLHHLIVERKVDLLVMHWLSYDTGSLIVKALKEGVPFVFVNHFDNARLFLPQTRKWITRAAAIGTVSGQGVPGDLHDNIVNLSDAVDTAFFTPEKARQLQFSSQLRGSRLILLPARIEEGKGHQDVIEVVRKLVASNLNLIACFAGVVQSEAYYQELRRLITTDGLEKRILFLGELGPDEIRDWYALSSVVVLPSKSEGLGRVLIEAQAMKKPVVAYSSGGISEALLHGETGFLVRTGDVGALAERISFLLENRTERLRMGECGRALVSRKFSFSALVQRHESFYLNTIARAPTKCNGQIDAV